MMVQPDRPPKNGFVKTMRKIYNPLGFRWGYNFILYFIFAGYVLGFIGARLPYLDIRRYMCGDSANAAGPGECYWYLNYSRYQIGITIHLAGILFASILAVFQFVPAIRHKAIMYHRIAGYTASTLVLVGNAGAIMIADRSMGGHIATQVLGGVLAIVSTTSIILAIYNIKRLQIDQHRKWMIRCWAYLTSIITLRIILILMMLIQPMYPVRLYESISCVKLDNIVWDTQDLAQRYPHCYSNGTVIEGQYTAVKADFTSQYGDEITAATHSAFAPAALVAFLLHAIGTEIYLWATPKETERLRTVSYQRQAEAGMSNPGSMGTHRDAEPWVPKEQRSLVTKVSS